MKWTQFNKGVFLVNLLGIIYNPKSKKILIGKRINDPNLKELSWVFPGGRPDYENELEKNMQSEILENTGLDVNVKNIVFSKTYPEIREFLSIYYYCEPIGSIDNIKPKGNLKELKWVYPTDALEYFTTSVHPTIINYLKTLN